MSDTHLLRFLSVGTVRVTCTYDEPYLNTDRATLKRYLTSALSYILQSDMGKAVVQTIVQKKGGFNLLFCSANTYNHRLDLVKWNPLSVLWFADCTEKRHFNRAQPTVDPTRPSNVQYSSSSQPYLVIGPASPAAVLFHELGHKLQSITRPQLFLDVQRSVDHNYQKVITGTDLIVQDLDYPAEVENCSRHEQAFMRDLWTRGICEGIRWHYQHSVAVEQVEDWRTETVTLKNARSAEVIRYKIGSKMHTQAFWGFSDRTGAKKKQVYLREYESDAKKIHGKLNVLPLPEGYLETCKGNRILPP